MNNHIFKRSFTDDYIPTIEDIRAVRERLGSMIAATPVWRTHNDVVRARAGGGELILKMELFQHGGSFKARGALANMHALDEDGLQRGVTAVSAGNHAIAVAHAARALGSTAKVVMPHTANPARVRRCKALGADVTLVEDVHKAFAKVRAIEREEGRAFIHPFDGPLTALGTAGVGYELGTDAEDLDAVIVPIGGGGLCAGVATALYHTQPKCAIYGVEPIGANTMTLSFAAGEPQAIDRVDTIADSLGAPHAAQYSFGLCRRFLKDIVLVTDDELCRAMALMFAELKLAVEPAAAAALAALCGPLSTTLAGKRVGLIICGANIDPTTFVELVRRGMEDS